MNRYPFEPDRPSPKNEAAMLKERIERWRKVGNRAAAVHFSKRLRAIKRAVERDADASNTSPNDAP